MSTESAMHGENVASSRPVQDSKWFLTKRSILCCSADWHWMLVATWRAECFPSRKRHLFLLYRKSYKHSIYSCVRPVEPDSEQSWELLRSMRLMKPSLTGFLYCGRSCYAEKKTYADIFIHFFRSNRSYRKPDFVRKLVHSSITDRQVILLGVMLCVVTPGMGKLIISSGVEGDY